MLREMLMRGKSVSYNPDHEDTRQLEMYGFIVNLFLVKEELKSNIFSEEGNAEKNLFIKNGDLDSEKTKPACTRFK